MLTTAHSLTKEVVSGVGSDIPDFKKYPRIAGVLAEIENRKDLTLGMVSALLANEVYLEIVAAGLYNRMSGVSFETKQEKQTAKTLKKEKIVAKSKFAKTLHGVFDLIRSLTTEYGKRGQIVANLFTTHLGILVASDRVLVKAMDDSRREAILEELQLYYIPVGLYGENWNEIPTQEIDPGLLFDVQLVEKSLLKLRTKSYTKVDTNSVITLVKMITEIMQRHKQDSTIQNWGFVKLRQLEEFSKSLELNWLNKVEYRANRSIHQPNRKSRRRVRKAH